MPNWLVLIASIFIILVTLGGMLNFPYIPLLLGIYESNRNTLKAKLLTRLLVLFPVVAFISIFLSWSLNHNYILIPFVYCALVWVLRLNRKREQDNTNSQTKEEILQDRLKEADYEWGDTESTTESTYVLFVLTTQDQGNAETLCQHINQSIQLAHPIEYKEKSDEQCIIEVRALLGESTKQDLIALTTKLANLCWQNSATPLSLSLIEE